MFDPSTHPSWCDPRVHVDFIGSSNVEHRDAPLAWHVAADDASVSVFRSQIDDLDPVAPDAGRTLVRFEITDMNGHTVGVDLSPADARMVAAALVCRAELVELDSSEVTS